MKVKCDYCGSFIEDTEETCPNCGAVNSHLMRSGDGVPKTIEELKAFCKARNLPLEQMRFFIGVDYKQPKAFGIYKDDDGNFIVYKNKGDGTRAERYRGKDEAYAVNEIYQKMRSEVQIRREKNGPSRKVPSASKCKRSKNRFLSSFLNWMPFFIIMAIIAVIMVICTRYTPSKGYYYYDDSYYYYIDSYWYRYDDSSGSWYRDSSVDSELSGHYNDYWEGSDYDSSRGATDFEDTDYYDSYTKNSNYNDDWDNGDWDFGGNWDAGDTDWDTDW